MNEPPLPPRTLTVPDEQRPALLDQPDPITALRERGGAWEAGLLTQQMTISLGSSQSCDLCLASPYVSALHAILERRGLRIRVHDQTSRNGTFFGGVRATGFDIGPGDQFTVATTTLLAMSDDMRLARPDLVERLGYDLDAVVDEVLIEGVRGANFLIIGEKGCGQRGLVKAIHQASLRRTRALVHGVGSPSLAEIEGARRGTLSFPVNGEPVDRDIVAFLLSAQAHVRFAAIAPSLDSAVSSLGVDAISRMHKVVIRPLRERGGDLDHLINRLFVDRRASMQMADLTARNQAALRAYAWPENVDELRKTVDIIAVLAREPNVTKAAELLGVARSSLRYKLDAIGLTTPILTNAPAPTGNGGVNDHEPARG